MQHAWAYRLGTALTLEKVQGLGVHEKPVRDLVLHPFKPSDFEVFDQRSVNRFIRALAATPPGPLRQRRLRQLAAEISTNPHPVFEKIRGHYQFIEVDPSGRVWFSNHRGEKLSIRRQILEQRAPLGARGQTWARALSELSNSAPSSPTYKKRLFRFAKYGLAAWLGLEALVPATIGSVKIGIQAMDQRQLRALHTQILSVETQRNRASQQIIDTIQDPQKTSAEREAALAELHRQVGIFEKTVERLKVGPGKSQLNINRALAEQDRTQARIQSNLRPWYRPTSRPPFVPVAPLLAALMRTARAWNTTEFRAEKTRPTGRKA